MRQAIAAALALVFLTAACSDDGSSSSGRGSETTTTTNELSTEDAPVVRQPWQVELPRSAAQTARVLRDAERALRDGAADPGDVEVAAWEQQTAYRVLRIHPEWAPDVAAAVPPDIDDAVAGNIAAGESLAALATDAAAPTELPDWTIAPPAPARELRGYYAEAEAASDIPWGYLAAIHLVETRLGRIQGTSTAGAQGPMQFIPSTWAAYGEGDINANRDAILAAGRYLDASGGPEDMDAALFSYNPSDDYVAAIQAYAGVLLADERAYRGYHGWQVYYGTDDGVYLLPEGYPQVPARTIG